MGYSSDDTLQPASHFVKLVSGGVTVDIRVGHPLARRGSVTLARGAARSQTWRERAGEGHPLARRGSVTLGEGL